jgi:hypothetical protein
MLISCFRRAAVTLGVTATLCAAAVCVVLLLSPDPYSKLRQLPHEEYVRLESPSEAFPKGRRLRVFEFHVAPDRVLPCLPGKLEASIDQGNAVIESVSIPSGHEAVYEHALMNQLSPNRLTIDESSALNPCLLESFWRSILSLGTSVLWHVDAGNGQGPEASSSPSIRGLEDSTNDEGAGE